MERDNRKSHLAPELSPATQELLRSTDSPSYANEGDIVIQKTPTGGKASSPRAVLPQSLTTTAAHRSDRRQAADHANLAAQVDRLYIRDWDHE